MKLWFLSHTVILKTFNPCSSARRWTDGGMSLQIKMYLPTEEGMWLSLTWTELACAEGCFPNDHCKLLLVTGAGEVLHMAFASCIISLCSAACRDVAAPQCLGDALDLSMTLCTVHGVVFIFLICFSLSTPHRRKLEETKLLRLGSNALGFSFWKVNVCVIIYRTPKAAVKWCSHKIS